MSATGLLVGSHFRPPAKQICQILPSGTSVELRKEPDNPYDSDAVAVWLPEASIQDFVGKLPSGPALDEFVANLRGCGESVDLLLTSGDRQLGYLAREGNRDLVRRAASCGPLASASQIGAAMTGASAGGTFVLGPSGEWLIKVEDL